MRIDATIFREIESRLATTATSGAPPAKSAASALGTGTTGFVKSLSEALSDMNRMQLQSNQNMASSVKGNGPPLHQVMAQSEEAGLAFQMTLQFRNKALEAYQEVMRMQF